MDIPDFVDSEPAFRSRSARRRAYGGLDFQGCCFAMRFNIATGLRCGLRSFWLCRQEDAVYL